MIFKALIYFEVVGLGAGNYGAVFAVGRAVDSKEKSGFPSRFNSVKPPQTNFSSLLMRTF